MSHPDWLTPVSDESVSGDDTVYDLAQLSEGNEVRDLGPGWLVLRGTEDSNWIRFAVVEHYSSNKERTLVSVTFYGEGPGGKDDSLRECRHTYWGDDGYLFYPNGPLISAAFQALAEFFDDMV